MDNLKRAANTSPHSRRASGIEFRSGKNSKEEKETGARLSAMWCILLRVYSAGMPSIIA